MDEQQLQQQIVQLVQAAMQGDKQATQQIQQIMQAAQQGDKQAAQIAQMIQQVAQQMQQQQVRAARFGAKLNYIRQLKGQCPEGYKMEYYKKGGQLCKKCMKRQENGGEVQQTPNTVAGQFKMEAAKCGKKMKKKEEGGAIEVEKCGGKPKLKKRQNGGFLKDRKVTKEKDSGSRFGKNVVEGSARSGKSNFDPNNTTLPSRNADGMQTPSRLQKSGEGTNDSILASKIKKKENGGPMQTDVRAIGINGNNYISRPSSIRHARNALAAANGRKTTSTTVNWSDGTSTQVNGQNRTVTGRDGATYQMGTAPADSVMRNDIAGPYLATDRSGQPFQINDRSRRMGVNTFRR